ncbi:MAG: hypothetical protein FWG14_00095 [Peptococcaceae bacterium]|nr:hypothetical protein [Peptococcaceae bacterium]
MNDMSEKSWYKLDNAAKIFPPTSSKSDTKVFRFSCELREAVDEKLLQSALDRTMDDFPSFRCILKNGMFWYYLEQSPLRPLVRQENIPPCNTLYLGRKTLLFDVTWYGRRINLEVYHALTDGTGALQFLKTLIFFYLKRAHPETMDKAAGIDYDASETQKMADSFDKYYDRQKKSASKFKSPVAWQLKGPKEAEWRLNIIEGSVSAQAVLNKAREYDTSATILITALLMRAIYGEMSVRDRRKPVVITVPVNLRNYFDSKSTRNFFSVINIKYDFKTNKDDIGEIIKYAKEYCAGHLNEEYLQTRLNKLLRFERNFLIRPIPLVVKDFCMSIAYSFAAREFTAAVSNLGQVRMPPEAAPYIRLFDVFSSTKTLQVCLCSYENTMNISFTSPLVSTDIQRSFFRQLSQMGIAVEITANHFKKEPTGP